MIGLPAAALVLAALGAAPAPEVHSALGEVHACLPLAGGGLVLATSGGLAELDGELRVRRVRTVLDGLPATRVDALLEEDGRLWVGGEAGLVQLESGADGLVLVRSWPSPPVRALARFGGALYLGTWGGGVLLLDSGADALVALPASGDASARRVTSLAVVGEALYVGTAGAGVQRLAGAALTPLALALPSRQVWALAAHRSQLWVGTLAGLARVDGVAVTTVRGADTRALVEAGGELFAATYGDGLVAVAARAERADAHAFVAHVGARGDALCAASPGVVRVRGSASAAWREVALGGLPSNDVSALAADGARLWIGTFDRGVAWLEGGRVHALGEADSASERDLDPQVNALAVERRAGRSLLWVATARGLSVIDGGRVRRLGREDGLPDEDVHTVVALASGGVVAGTGHGAVVLRDGRAEILGRKQGLPGHAVWAAAEDAAGRLWLGTSVGLLLWYGDGRWQRYSVASGHLDDDWVTALAVSGDALWVGTYAGGVARLAVGAGGGAVAVKLGGGHVNFGGLTVHGGEVYAATMEGLRVRAADGGGAWRPLAATLGVDVTAVAVAPGGGVWVATRRGLARLVER